MANSRLAVRASFFTEVDVLSSAEAMPQRLWGQDLSEAGIFLQTTRPFHPGDRLSLRFDVPGREVHVRAAEVVWVKSFEPINVDGALPGIGVRFLSVDPPARAAIRRYVQAGSTPRNDDVPTPPPSPELSGPFVLESLRPLSLPPFESVSPLAILEPNRDDPLDDPEEWTSTLHDAATLPPDPALLLEESTVDERTVDESTLVLGGDEHGPDEHSQDEHSLDEQDEHDRDERSMDERDVDDPPHPLAGWRFEVLREPEPELMPSPDAVTRRPRPATLPPMPPPDAGFSLDDEGDTAPPLAISLPPFELSGPQVPPRRLDLSFSDEKQERGPDVLALAAHEKLDKDFFAGKLAVAELPQAEQRGLDAVRTRRLRIAWAAGLLLAGGALGVVVGYEPGPEVATKAPTLETRVALLPAPKPVAEAEKELLATAPATPQSAPVATAAKEAPAASVPFVSPDEVATSASGKLPRKEPVAAEPDVQAPQQQAPREDVSLTSAAASSTTQDAMEGGAERASGVRVEYGRVTLPLEGGRVARSFGLDNPARVVVDLVDAQLPKQRSEEIGEKGIARVRFGRPDPVHVRVVVELAGADAPTGITTLKRGSSLAVAWR